MSPAIEIIALTKSFGDQIVLDAVDLGIPPGGVFALLGPNGAGKTTMIRILSTLLRADSGTARVAGHDVVQESAAVRAAIGVTGQFSAVDALMTGEENLRRLDGRRGGTGDRRAQRRRLRLAAGHHGPPGA